MKNFTLKNFFTYSLAVICATCAVIAGVFSMSTNNVKAEETTIDVPRLYTVAFVPDQDVIKATASLSEDLVNRLNTYSTSNYETENFQTAPNYSVGEYSARNIYYLVFNYSDNLDDYGKILTSSSNSLWFGSSDNLTVESLTPTVTELEITTQASGLSTVIVSLPINFDFSKTHYYWFSIVKHSRVNYIDKITEHQGTPTIAENHWVYENRLYSQSDYRELNVKTQAMSYLKTINDNTNVAYNNGLLKYAGYTVKSTDNVTINLTYKQVKDFAQVETITEPFLIEGWRILQQNYIKDYMYNVLGKSNISDFNAVYSAKYYQDGSVFETQDRVFLQAEDLQYSFDKNSNVGTLNVNYAPFKYSNFVIRITNNNPTNNLTLDYFTSNVVDNGSKTIITYDFETIKSQLYNSLGWMFDINYSDFEIINAPNITTTLSDELLTISFSNTYENNLSELSIMLVAEIIPDYEVTIKYAYAVLDEQLNEEIRTTLETKRLYSEVLKIQSENFKTLNYTQNIYKELITKIQPEILNGQVFYSYKGIVKDFNEDKTECTIRLIYDYNTLLKVTDSLGLSNEYLVLNSNSLTYTYEQLSFNVPSGYRIKKVSSDGNVKISFNEHTPENLTITINESTAQKKIITLTAELSDSWHVKVNYLERYKSTPFAEYKTVNKEVSVSEYGEIKNITIDQTAKIVGKSTLNVLKSTVESIDVEYNGSSTYTITPKYTYLSLKMIDYDGNSKEIKVPLTCYEDYCKMFGQDWSILWLNDTQNKYFEFSNSVERDKLYGYFNVAVFETQVSDFNALFANDTNDGCMTIFKSEKVVGSDLYKFANNMKSKLLFAFRGYALMTFCEVLNDNNKILESYFFYLDVDSDKPFLSIGGSDDAGDEDGAGENFGEDVKDEVEDGMNNVKDKLDNLGDSINDWIDNNPFAQFLKILGYVLIGGLVLAILIWLIKKAK